MEINNELFSRKNVFWVYFSWILRAGRFFKFRFIEFKKLVGAIKRFGVFAPFIKFWIANLFVYSLVWPLARIILGKEKSYSIYNYLVKIPAPPGTFSFPALTKIKVALKNTTDWGVFIEIYISDTYHKDTLKQAMTVVDVGAHVGLYTVLAAEKTGPTGKVIAIEPEPQNYDRILENIRINGFGNVVVEKAALSDHNGFEKLHISPSSARHSLLAQEHNSNFAQVTVKTLDVLLEELAIKKVDVIKIDAEGAEVPILKGMGKTLKNNPDVKIIVASYHYPAEVKEVQNFLHKMGFKTEVSFSNIIITT